MVKKPTDPQVILERCITENSNEAWDVFLSVFGPLIRRVCHALAEAKSFSDFGSWFPGWLFYERKLHSAYRGLQTKIQNHECLTAESQNRYLANSLATIVRATVAEFAHEWRPKAETQASASILAALPAMPSGSQRRRHDEILGTLHHLPPKSRVPFWLRYYAILGPLTATDAAWIANQVGLSVACVTEIVLQEADANRGHQKPLSSEFIGSPLNIPPCTDGRYSTLDQCVRRRSFPSRRPSLLDAIIPQQLWVRAVVTQLDPDAYQFVVINDLARERSTRLDGHRLVARHGNDDRAMSPITAGVARLRGGEVFDSCWVEIADGQPVGTMVLEASNK